MGIDVELEHGTQDLESNVTDDDVTVTAEFARAPQRVPGLLLAPGSHEAEAEAYWAARGE